jgi:NADH dehydrogenase
LASDVVSADVGERSNEQASSSSRVAVDPPADHVADVLILGASLLGVELVFRLRRQLATARLSLLVVDRRATHGYIPLCHELLSRRLRPEHATLDTRRYVELRPGDRYVQGEVTSLDRETNVVTLADGRRLKGRFVVVALGSEVTPPPSLPGADGMERVKFAEDVERATLRIDDAIASFVDGAAAGVQRGDESPATKPRLVVVGGGITGVELAGELAHEAKLRRADPSRGKTFEVALVHGGSRLLPDLRPRAARLALDALARQGVEVRMSTRLVHVEASRVLVDRAGARESLACALAFWAGGIRPAPILADLGLPQTEDGWLAVGPTPTPTHPTIFAGGDAVRIEGGEGRWRTMQRAIECLWQAKTLAKQLATLAAWDGALDDVPPLVPHRTWEDFPHGVSIGARSLIVYGRLSADLRGFGVWFRRFLMRQYLARYRG